MANLPEANTWEPGIYQIEKTDPVDGGPDGLSNTQGKQLANRTTYLKQEVELRAPLASPAFTGNPTAPTQAPGNSSTRLANTAFVQAAVQALVDAAPGALDTLNELAAALGDDPNFATTIMTALAGKADILRGVPTGTISVFTGTAAPAGWVKGNGALLSRATYADLYAHAAASGMIVTDAAWLAGETGKYSEGDGSGTFRVPLLHAEFPRFWDDGRGVDAGRALGSWQKASGVSVDDNGTSSAYVTQLSGTADTGTQAVALQRLGLDVVNPADYAGTEPTWTDASGTGGFSTAGMRPRNLAYLGIIKY